MLARRAEIDPVRIVVIGHDEGGIFASHAAATVAAPTKVSGLVTIGMPGRVYHKILREQEQKRLVEEGKSPAEVNDYLDQFDRLTVAITSGSADAAQLNIDRNDPIFKPIIGNVTYFFNQFQTDPLQVIRGVQVPVLIVQGEKDALVEVKDANYLNEMLRGQYNVDYTMKTFPEMDHWMRVQKGPATLTIDEPTRPLDPAFLSALSDWLAKRFK
jgi:pimeloyl-ACP methyl ester carboxylesterase